MLPVHQRKHTPDLDSVKVQINKIRLAFGSPSVACGVLHHGQVIFRLGEGLAEVEAGRRPDADTVYPIGSCTKAFTAATCAILVQEGLLSWDEPVSTYIPEFRTVHDEEVGQKANLVDMLSHATGLAPTDHAILGFHDEHYSEGADQVRISSNLPVGCGFRAGFVYNNFMYGLVGEVIQRVCSKSAGAVMKDKIFRPLNLDRTCTSAADYPPDGNIATGYSVVDNGTLLPLDDPRLEDGAAQGAAGFVRSTVNDMLAWAKAVMEAESQQHAREASVGFDGLLPGIALTRSARRHITSDPTGDEDCYGLGWFRHTIPSRWLGSISPNFMLLPDPPVIGRLSQRRLAISHYGASGGFLSSFYTFPDTCSAIIVMANSSPSRGDPTDLIAQSLCQELFDMRPKIPLQSFALKAAETSKLIWPTLVRNWVLSRAEGDTAPPAAADYVGSYRHANLPLQVDISEVPRLQPSRRPGGPGKWNMQSLTFSVNGLARQTAKLRHYHHDVWTFLPNSRDDAARKGMERYMSLPSILLSFARDKAGRISSLEWDVHGGWLDDAQPQGMRNPPPIRFQKTC
ncbi:hypothetical protein MKZ38_001004 [Zalerion maritima]|uniref:Beta-lactamase-related domain-containing protein n=1 Tax=Zalerion maritima TaxID=339359 RepID=A0AAD5WRQ5_9PEZI|nr:hypothetical protein MKZ38_001004 [Zalerion maritima]